MKRSALRLLALQLDLRWHDPAANRAQIETLLAPHAGTADLILLPEMFTTGYTMEGASLAEDLGGPTVDWMAELALKQQAALAGSLIVKEHGKLFNRMVVMGPEDILAEYNKRHLFRFANEQEHYAPGEEWVLFEYKGWRIAPMICYDLRFPVWSRNRLAPDGRMSFDLLLYVANWPEARISHWDVLLRARAIENQAFVAGVNRVGTDGNGVAYNGSSALIDPKGQVLAHETGHEALLRATLDPEAQDSYRDKFPAWLDADTFDLLL